MMKNFGFWWLYVITTLILVNVAVIPFWNFIIMLQNINSRPFKPFDVTVVIPFMAVSMAILIVFLLLPALRNTNITTRRFVTSVIAIGIFTGLSVFAETIAEILSSGRVLMNSRMMPPPSDIAIMQSSTTIPLLVRVHYYIFSIILILAVLNFLYNLADTLYKDGKFGNKAVAIQGIATACYALAYFLVRIVQYENFAARQITWGSVLNSAVCFILAAISVGLYSASFIKFKGFGRFVPSVVSIITIFALYGAQYIMLEGNFYAYGSNAIVAFLLRILIALIPGVTVYFLGGRAI
ncbi:MAG: hypothetical protein FWE27_09055 [Defluviitaleaceae bacterium]|nr:hypothetical protein [Defluviitaleaceae bacterium]